MSTDSHLDEYADKTPEQRKVIKSYKEALLASQDYVKPFFEKGVRFYRLYSGELPPEIDGTFSKVMLWFAYAMVDMEVPQSIRGLMTSPEWFAFEANDMMLEPAARTAEKWCKYQLEKKQNIARNIVSSVQSEHIFGTGYRHYGHKYLRKSTERRAYDEIMGMPYNFRTETEDAFESVIHGNDTSFFNVFPSPGGGQVNDHDESGENAADYVIVMTYPTKRYVESMVQKGIFDKAEAGKMFKNARNDEEDPSAEYKEDLFDTQGGWGTYSMPAWLRTMRDKQHDIGDRYRLAFYYRRGKWCIIGEDRFVLYNDEPMIKSIPLAKFTGTYNLQHWFGLGLIEPSEDLIDSMILNFNHRMDYLAGTLHPPAFVPEELLDELGGDESIFDPKPYQVIPYSYMKYKAGGIASAVHRDRFPDINQQAFYEEGKMQEYLQEIIGQPSFSKGMQGAGNPGDIGATGVVSLISQGAARQMQRALNTENSGLRDSLYLTMEFGAKYRNEDEMVRVTGADGFPWMNVPHQAITNGYGISITGSRTIAEKEETFRQMLSTAPFVLGNPVVQDQVEAQRQLMSESGWKNVDDMLGSKGEMAPFPESPGVGGQATAQNEINSMNNRQTVQPNTGRAVAAGNVLV